MRLMRAADPSIGLNSDEEKWQPRGIGAEKSSAETPETDPAPQRKKTSGKP